MLAAQPGEMGLGIKLLVGTSVGATEGGTGVRGEIVAPLVLLSFPIPVSALERAREIEERRLITFSDNLRQFRVDTRKGLLPVKSSSMAVSGPETDSCSPVIVSEICGGRKRPGGVKWEENHNIAWMMIIIVIMLACVVVLWR